MGEVFLRKSARAGWPAQVLHDFNLRHEVVSGDLQFEKKRPQ